MYVTIRQQMKHLSKKDYRTIRNLCHIAKNLANQALYNVRQHYFREKKYLNYYQNWNILKHSENYKKLQSELDKNEALAIDLGVNNLATCVTTQGETFIIDGRKLKAINQWYNKRNPELQGIKGKQ